MRKNILMIFVMLSLIAIVPVLATPVAVYDLKSSLTYDDATLNLHIAQLNPYNILTAATVSITSVDTIQQPREQIQHGMHHSPTVFLIQIILW